MAVSSGVVFLTLEKMLNNGAALSLEAEDNKGALFTDTVVPNFATDTAYGAAPYNANEVTGTGWSAGGVALTGTEITTTGSVLLKFDATDVSEASTTLTNAEGYLLYAAAVANEAFMLIDLGAAYSTVNGTFAITWHADGILTIDLTP